MTTTTVVLKNTFQRYRFKPLATTGSQVKMSVSIDTPRTEVIAEGFRIENGIKTVTTIKFYSKTDDPVTSITESGDYTFDTSTFFEVLLRTHRFDNFQQQATIRLTFTGDTVLPRFVEFGDSYAVYDQYAVSTSITRGTSGLFHFMTALCGDHRMTNINAGVGGQNSYELLARFQTDVMALSPDIVVGVCGANDFFGDSLTAEEVLTNVLYMIDVMLAAGIEVGWCNSPTQGTARSFWTLAKQKEAIRYNRLLASAAATRSELTVFDLENLIIDPSDQTNFAPLTNFISVADGIHLTHSSTLRFGKTYNPWLESRLPTLPRKFSMLDNRTETWSDSLLPAGVGQMAGTSGTLGANGSGTLPTGWTGSATASAPAVYSIIPDVGGNWLEIAVTVSAVATLQQINVSTATFHTFLAQNDQAEMMFEMEIEPGAATVKRFFGRFYNVVGGLGYSANWNDISNGDDTFVPDQAITRVFPITPKLTFASAPTTSQCYFYMNVMGTGTAKMRIRNVKPYKVTS